MTMDELIQNMEQCEQAPGVSMLDHGLSVLTNMTALVSGRPRGPVPMWYAENRESIVGAMPDVSVWGAYAIYHDCGKHQVLEIDDQGRRHFPMHAEASMDLWLSVRGYNSDSIMQSAMMLRDMAMHTLTVIELDDMLSTYSVPGQLGFRDKLWSTLLISSLAELHTNAPMFGGFETDSFKIKAKQIRRRGSQVCRLLFGAHHA